MNKTLTVNISGIVFHIDETAYETLKEYLKKLHDHFSKIKGGDEIMQDIEIRIAEIFQSKLNDTKKVILEEDVKEVMAILGMPKDFTDNAEAEEVKAEKTIEEEDPIQRRRLYRDEDDKVLGGVCSGLAYYFNTDPLWFRLGFILATLIYGSSILLYIVLWLIIPKAKTLEEKLEMKRNRFSIHDIESNVKEEFGDIRSKFKRNSKKARQRTKEEFHEFKEQIKDVKGDVKSSYKRYKRRSSSNDFVNLLGNILYYFVKAVGIFIGVIFVLVGLGLLLGLLFSLFGSSGDVFISDNGFNSISIPGVSSLFFESSTQAILTIIALILLLGIPFLMLIYWGVKLVFSIKHRVRIISITAGSLWLAGIILSVFMTISIYGNFKSKSIKSEEFNIVQPKGDVLYIDVPINNIDKNILDNDEFELDEGHCSFLKRNGNEINIGYPRIKIIPGDTTGYSLSIIKTSRGKNINDAKSKAGNIKYNCTQKDSILILNDIFSIPLSDKWRNQKVTLVLKVPVGKKIILSKNMGSLGDCFDISDGSWSSDMIEKQCKMTSTGLESEDSTKIIVKKIIITE